MVWILIDVSFEYEEKFDIDQERFQNFSESISFNHYSPSQSFDTHSSDEYFSDSQSSDAHDASRVPENFFVKRKIVRIRVESRAKFLGRKIEFSNFELSQPSFSSRYNQDRQIMQIKASSDNMDVDSKEFIDVVNTTNSQETVIIPSINVNLIYSDFDTERFEKTASLVWIKSLFYVNDKEIVYKWIKNCYDKKLHIVDNSFRDYEI
ncbi:5248_t:CDS:2 [Dentiscutata heterogama]|uniref:5248_t:CDS:1 n=1 Tax=Dentiscutata heterogama TaxID=1316150 RepID=A0ACA9JZ55_9GLOM|nr:5248_t:CDS:2 [Dentiscutata heterogama]